jgi:23S rRNA (uracil1939-C5)-methyltransferase/tRNA (uracil-5-)-methyltransferase
MPAATALLVLPAKAADAPRIWHCEFRPAPKRGAVGKKKARFNDLPFSYHEEIELEISTLTNLGSGLGRFSRPGPEGRAIENWVVMVPFTLPGERVRARVFRNHRNFSEADLLEVLVASPDRVTAPCPLYGRCGGCQYQHLAYPAQLEWKRRQVAELLEHMAGLSFPVAPVQGSPREWGYRSKITPHFAAPRDLAVPPAIGFLRQGTRFDILDVPRCAIATDAINTRLEPLRDEVRARAAAGGYQRGATLLLREASGEVTTDFDAAIVETVGNLRLRFLARDFFQNNPFILPAFTSYVREQAAASGASYLVDAYCGSGLFALTAAPAFVEVTGIEISESSVAFARENAATNGITNARFEAGDAARIFAGLRNPASDTVVVIDPPRKGCDEAFLTQLFGFGPRAVVYVSCDPATQMRDLRHFLDAGYVVRAVQPFDLFPQTRHLECIITLERSAQAAMLTAASPGVNVSVAPLASPTAASSLDPSLGPTEPTP